MKLKQQSSLKTRTVAKLVRIVNRLENDGNTDMETNGEKKFISGWCEHYKNTDPVTVFDIGANIGEYVEDLITYSPNGGIHLQIHAFEPSSAIRALQEKAKKFKNILPIPFGLSDASGEHILYADKDGSKLSTVYVRDRANYKTVWKPSGKAVLMRADAYIEEKKIDHIHLVKIDVEGHEIPVLKGFGKYLNSDFIDYIQFEYSEANMDSHTTLFELYEILEKAGFIIYKIMPYSLEKRAYSRGAEHYHYSNWVAISPKARTA